MRPKRNQYLLAGLGLVGVGLWLRFDPVISDLVVLIESQDNVNLSAYLLMGSGFLMTVLGFCGCFGAWRLHQFFLCTFFVLLLIVFCMELTCAVIAYSHQDIIKQYIENSMYQTIQHKYMENSKYRYIFDNIQSSFECCGVKSYRDWLYSKWSQDGGTRAELGIGAGNIGKVPPSCCNRDGLLAYPTDCGVSFDKMELWTYEHFLYLQGCSDALYHVAYQHLNIAIVVSVAVGTTQVSDRLLSLLTRILIRMP
ncbi:hypothetical protein L596_003411 [Steinernema carpocapsae]|uniref:Tetraspanin n=1 Tax=Steinernema carpocapsae TaxID=34508 RepID=A0A4U8UWH0_STECR|nr:hypothetical protein L596_003411 [Steinernema carpocapsae]